jgi:Lysozyme inhibitor LprI
MNRLTYLVCCAGFLFLDSRMPCAQQTRQILSFEAGGKEACAKALDLRISTGVNGFEDRTFEYRCAERDLEIEQSEFVRIRKSTASRGPKYAQAFHALLDAFESFRLDYIRVQGEGCTGTGCGASLARTEAAITFDFLQMVEGFRKDGLPHFSADDFAKADASLNAAYKEALGAAGDTCSPEDKGCKSEATDIFRESERTWLRYRDAWISFGAVRWPEVTKESWLCYLTRQRLEKYL